MDLQEQIARIELKQVKVRAVVAEQHAFLAKDARAVSMFPVGGMIAGAALFGAGAAFMKLLGA